MSQLDATSQEVPATGLEKFLEDNFRKLVWLFVILILALCAYGVIHHQNTLKAHEAAEAFTAAKTVEDCDLVIARYPGTTSAANALLAKAALLWDQNKKTSAVDVLKAFTTSNATSPQLPQALLNLGARLDSLGERKEAQAIFERLTREFSASDVAPLAQMRLGDLLWAEGKSAEAKKAYEDLAVKFPGMEEYQTLSQGRLDWLAASLPTKEVDPPPAPKVEAKPAAAPGSALSIPGLPKINLAAPGSIGATPAAAAQPTAPAPTLTPAPKPAAPAPASAPPPAVPAPAPAKP